MDISERFLERSTNVWVVVLFDEWKSSARASMTRSFTIGGDELVERALRKAGSVSDRTRIKIGMVGVAMVCMLDKLQTEGESRGWASDI